MRENGNPSQSEWRWCIGMRNLIEGGFHCYPINNGPVMVLMAAIVFLSLLIVMGIFHDHDSRQRASIVEPYDDYIRPYIQSASYVDAALTIALVLLLLRPGRRPRHFQNFLDDVNQNEFSLSQEASHFSMTQVNVTEVRTTPRLLS